MRSINQFNLQCMECLHMRANTLKRERNIVRKCLSQFIFQCIHTEQYLRIYALMDFLSDHYNIFQQTFNRSLLSIVLLFSSICKICNLLHVNQTFTILIMFHAFTSVAIKLYAIPKLPWSHTTTFQRSAHTPKHEICYKTTLRHLICRKISYDKIFQYLCASISKNCILFNMAIA